MRNSLRDARSAGHVDLWLHTFHLRLSNARRTLDFTRRLFRQHERPPAPAEGGKCRLPASDPAGERMSLQLPGQEMHRKLCLLLRPICSPSNASSHTVVRLKLRVAWCAFVGCNFWHERLSFNIHLECLYTLSRAWYACYRDEMGNIVMYRCSWCCFYNELKALHCINSEQRTCQGKAVGSSKVIHGQCLEFKWAVYSNSILGISYKVTKWCACTWGLNVLYKQANALYGCCKLFMCTCLLHRGGEKCEPQKGDVLGHHLPLMQLQTFSQ